MSAWGGGWGTWQQQQQTGGMGQGGSASGYSYLRDTATAGTGNQNTTNQGGWNYGGQAWNYGFGKNQQQQQQQQQQKWSTAADDEDWGFGSNQANQNQMGWRNMGGMTGSGHQANKTGWNNGGGSYGGGGGGNYGGGGSNYGAVGTGTFETGGGSYGQGGNASSERKRARMTGTVDGRSGKRRQRDFDSGWGGQQDYNYNYCNEYGTTGLDFGGWGDRYGGGGWDADDGYGGYSQGYGGYAQIPGQGSNWGAAGGDYYDEDAAYNYQFDFGGSYQGGYEDPQDYYEEDFSYKTWPKETNSEWKAKLDTVDDKLMYKKLRTLTQLKDERKGLTNAVRNITNAMRAASETFSQEANTNSDVFPFQTPTSESEENGNKEEDPLPPQVLVGVIRVGPAIRKLLLKGSHDLGAELVAVFKSKPTKEQFRRLAILIAQNLKSPFADKVSIRPDELLEKIVIKVDASECLYPISISCTSPEYCPEFEGKPESDTTPEELLSEKKCLEALANIRRIRWCKQMRDDIELPVVRIFLDLSTRLPGWKHLRPYHAEVLVHTVMDKLSKDTRESELTISRVFIQCIEMLAEGLIIRGGPGLKDPCEAKPMDVFGDLTPQASEDLTKAAQLALRLIACDRMKHLLSVSL